MKKAVLLIGFVFVAFVAACFAFAPRMEDPVDPVWKHGFGVGYSLAKSGMVRPTYDELDAYSRQAAKTLRFEAGDGFKMHWKSGFDAGWRRGD